MRVQHIRLIRQAAFAAAALCVAACGVQAQPCVREWRTAAGEPGFSGGVRALAVFDEDGAGPAQPALYAAGAAGFGPGLGGIGRWNGAAWSPVGDGLTGGGEINSLCVHDPDGPGPEPASLYAAGQFTSIGNVLARNIARWDGVGWRPLGNFGAGPQGVVYAMVIGPDGTMVVSGDFTAIDGAAYPRLAGWNGTGWQAAGPDAGLRDVRAMTVFDADGPQGMPPLLYIAGNPISGSPPVVFRLTGGSWSLVGVFNEGVMALAGSSADGTPKLYAGGNFTTVNGVQALRVARWDGTQWSALEALGDGVDGLVRALASWGDSLYIGGTFSFTASGLAANRVLAWRAASGWAPLAGGITAQPGYGVEAMLPFLTQTGESLVIAGRFEQAGGQPAVGITEWIATGDLPAVTQVPAGGQLVVGRPLVLAAAATGSPPLTFRWRRNGFPLTDDARITGAATLTLAISPSAAGDTGVYDLVVTNSCGSVLSQGVEVDIVPCPFDTNSDGTVTSSDISAFLTGWLQAVTGGC